MTTRRTSSGGRPMRALRLATIAAAAALCRDVPARAHEGHAALPTKGAAVQGNQLMVSARALKALGVECARVTLKDLRRVVRARARVESPWFQQAMIATVVPGRIERVSARPGDAVRPGQELARIESLVLEDFQRDLLRADAEFDLARRIFEQKEELGRLKVIGGLGVVEAGHKRDEAATQAVVAAQKLLALGLDRDAIARLRETKQPVGVLPISAPTGGVVSEADVRAGQVVSIDQHLYHLVDNSKVSVVAEVLESDVAAVGPGRPIRAHFFATDATIEGRVDHVHPGLDAKTRTRQAVAHVENPGGILKPGQTGRAEIEVDRIEQAVVCPAASLIDASGGPYVLFRKAEGRFDRRKVVVGLRDGDDVEIRDGLFPGDQVVSTGKQLLAAMFHYAAAPAAASAGRAAEPAPGSAAIQGEVELPTQARVRISPLIEGRLAKILVEPGERVEAGQVVAEVDSLPLRNLQLEFLRARLEREWTTGSVARLRALVADDVISQRGLWTREGELVVIETELANLRAKLLAVGLPPEDLGRLESVRLASEPEGGVIATVVPLRARVGGVVSDFEVVPGQVVRPSDSLFEVLDTSLVWVRGRAFERDAAAIRVGDEARVSFPALPGRESTGRVVRVAPVMGADERVLPFWIELENPDGVLPEGAMARITLSRKTK